MSQLVVAAECPSCGAPLDVSEGVTTLRCGNCRSQLLVTGHGQVLGYHVPAVVTGDAARALARAAHPGAEVVADTLHFIPYYRLVGHDFGWQARLAEPEPLVADAPGPRAGLAALLGGEDEEGRALAAAIMADRPKAAVRAEGPLQLVDRYVEKSFVARELPDFTAYSLGIRAQVLRVCLFGPDTAAALGTVVGVGIDADTALRRGLLENAAGRIVHREVLARILSVIYFPYWTLELRRRDDRWLTLIDGVVPRVAQPRAPATLRAALDVRAAGAPPTAGFRPLVCPNCGWDLPLSGHDVVFACAACERAWQLEGATMTEAAHEIADMAGAGDAVFLPCWRLELDGREQWVPAFRYRRLKTLAQLTQRLAATPVRYARWTGARPPLRGCFYDAADAARLARFVAAGQPRALDAPSRPAGANGSGHATLVWLPFRRQGQALLDPVTGLELQPALLA